jgi:hypothetical protein
MSKLQVGMHVNWETWENGGKWYSGVITEIEGDTVHVKGYDGKMHAVDNPREEEN